MNIVGFGIRSFKSFDHEGVYLDTSNKINLIIGKNNVGKSNILSFLCRLSQFCGTKQFHKDLINQHKRDSNPHVLEIKISAKELSRHYPLILKGYPPEKILSFLIDTSIGRIIKSDIQQLDNVKLLALQSYYSAAANEELLKNIDAPLNVAILKIIDENFKDLIYIPHYREIREIGSAFSPKQINGEQVISKLFEMQHPVFEQDYLKSIFLNIQEFIRELLGEPSLEIEVPHDKTTILINLKGLRLPLVSFGTGIHELIILSTALALYENHVICIEEPELHLHPELQRKFLKFLEKTNNTYYITTHSNVFLDFNKNISIYYAANNGECTSLKKIETTSEAYQILDDLGYRASDILQSNGIIWVEGPSDRIYINKWINLLDPKLTEGLHYSIMFYGGRLLAHLSLKENIESSFIPLLKINKNAIIVIDSDMHYDTDKINSTKKRIEEEVISGLCWITSGKEIENYLTNRTLQEYLKADSVSLGRYDNIDEKMREVDPKIKYAEAKVKYSRELANFIQEKDLESLDLKSKIEEVISLIKDWNHGLI